MTTPPSLAWVQAQGPPGGPLGLHPGQPPDAPVRRRLQRRCAGSGWRSHGRATIRGALANDDYIAVAAGARKRGIRIKVNTVVSALNASQDMTSFIEIMRPERWKLLQVLPVAGQNDGEVEPLLIAGETFRAFVERHHRLSQAGIAVVGEDNASMTGSYAMVDPAGRFFDNTAGRHTYSRSILAEGVDAAWADIRFHLDRFVDRGGVYQW